LFKNDILFHFINAHYISTVDYHLKLVDLTSF